jgi:hypothetical protein
MTAKNSTGHITLLKKTNGVCMGHMHVIEVPGICALSFSGDTSEVEAILVCSVPSDIAGVCVLMFPAPD